MWHQQDRWKARLVAETTVMRSRFPKFALLEQRGELMWTGPLKPIAEVDLEFSVVVVYPTNYPYHPPTLWVLNPELEPGAPHTYVDGSLCVYAKNWDPERGTAASCVTLISAWLIGYLYWLQTGVRF
jgi:hypothetical protein